MPLRMRIGLVLGLLLTASASSGQDGDVSLERMKKDLFFLASPLCEGRGPGTKGIDLAADHIAKQFAAAGVRPGGGKGGYFQPFEIEDFPELEQPNRLTLRGPQGQTIELSLNRDFNV